jgi:hypothetical protein
VTPMMMTMMMRKAAYGIMYESKPTTSPSFMHKSIWQVSNANIALNNYTHCATCSTSKLWWYKLLNLAHLTLSRLLPLWHCLLSASAVSDKDQPCGCALVSSKLHRTQVHGLAHHLMLQHMHYMPTICTHKNSNVRKLFRIWEMQVLSSYRHANRRKFSV